jgi:hypothetical protein
MARRVKNKAVWREFPFNAKRSVLDVNATSNSEFHISETAIAWLAGWERQNRISKQSKGDIRVYFNHRDCTNIKGFECQSFKPCCEPQRAVLWVDPSREDSV